MDDDYKGVHNQTLEELINKVKSQSEYKAICQISVSVHGYGLNYQIRQLASDRLVMQEWGSFAQFDETAFKPLKVKLNLVEALQTLREENAVLRTTIDSGRHSRFGTIYIATATDGDWITCKPLGGGDFATHSIIDKLYYIVFFLR